ncbi:MAG: hypothetical protein RLZ56_98 [Bacteroidota bacterium]|jgi:hypothetical protein
MQLLLLYFLFSIFNFWGGQDMGMCNQNNNAYNSGEKVRYTIYYNVLGLYVNAGRADFSIQNTNWNGSDAFTFTAVGKSNAKYDWIFKVRDTYESVVDAKSLLPYQFTREIREGGYHYSESIQFNQKAKTVTNTKTSATYKAADCTYDVVSAIYAARNINYTNCQMNDKIYLNFFLDKELYPSYFKYLGKDVITTRYGKFKVIKLAPLLVKGTIFKDGDKMVVWVTDDENHIPVRIETPIVVGSIKVDMVGYEHLRHPLSSLIQLAGDED